MPGSCLDSFLAFGLVDCFDAWFLPLVSCISGSFPCCSGCTWILGLVHFCISGLICVGLRSFLSLLPFSWFRLLYLHSFHGPWLMSYYRLLFACMNRRSWDHFLNFTRPFRLRQAFASPSLRCALVSLHLVSFGPVSLRFTLVLSTAFTASAGLVWFGLIVLVFGFYPTAFISGFTLLPRLVFNPFLFHGLYLTLAWVVAGFTLISVRLLTFSPFHTPTAFTPLETESTHFSELKIRPAQRTKQTQLGGIDGARR